MTLPSDILKAIDEGPNMDERFNDEWRRRELFAKRIAEMAYAAGWRRGFEEAEPTSVIYSSDDAQEWAPTTSIDLTKK